MSTAIHWFRRDLRLTDNQNFHAACTQHDAVIPLYISSTWKKNHNWTGSNRQQFLCGSLASLHANLSHHHSYLVIRHGCPIEQIEKLARETSATHLYYQPDPDPHGKKIEKLLEKKCAELGIKIHAAHDVTIIHPDALLTGQGTPYRVYTPYSKAWFHTQKNPPLPKPNKINTPHGIFSESLPNNAHWHIPPSTAEMLEPGEKAARTRMKNAAQKIASTYKSLRDFPALSHTSRLSQDLRFGLISARSLWHTISQQPQQTEGHHTLLKELVWREFYIALLHHYPEVLEWEFNTQWRGLPWDEPDEKWHAWTQGLTGFPIVDAGMRELLATGHMHNRVRMIVAMFLTKDLHYDWRLGESWFMRHLVDGEIASNNGGWQWSAGTGADAAPYFRIQNPWTQTQRYDPDGTYIKKWLPELKHCDSNKFHSPPDTPLAPDYPLPILDHNTERNRTLAIFQKHKENSPH